VCVCVCAHTATLRDGAQQHHQRPQHRQTDVLATSAAAVRPCERPTKAHTEPCLGLASRVCAFACLLSPLSSRGAPRSSKLGASACSLSLSGDSPARHTPNACTQRTTAPTHRHRVRLLTHATHRSRSAFLSLLPNRDKRSSIKLQIGRSYNRASPAPPPNLHVIVVRSHSHQTHTHIQRRPRCQQPQPRKAPGKCFWGVQISER
jgi:hypothetical protein